MAIPPIAVAMARMGWNWQWNQLMNGLAPADHEGNYQRPPSQHQKALVPNKSELKSRPKSHLPHLIIGRSCPWAHRTWLIYQLRDLKKNLNLIIAKADKKAGRWSLEPSWLGCESLLAIYQKCGQPPTYRATVPTLIDPGEPSEDNPKLLGNESAQLVEVLNQWPVQSEAINLAPENLQEDIQRWQNLIQPSVNDGVYRCGFARTQSAYDKASSELFQALKEVERSLSEKGPWLCGDQLTLADVRLFPTLIRWEMVYEPLFGCSKEPLWTFSNLWKWRQRFLSLPKVIDTCDSAAWRYDYFGALFPLRPSGIVPSGPNLVKIVNSKAPNGPK